MQSQKANSPYLGGQVRTVPVALPSIPSDSHLCTLHSRHQRASSIQIQMKTYKGGSQRAISSGRL